MIFDYQNIDLPVKEVIPALQQKLSAHNTVILKAPPGAGKSTLLPLTLLNEDWCQGRKIFMLEPRRLAAKSIAERMAYFLGEPVGQTVGYRVRFDTRVGPDTKIEVLTEGILTRMLQSDNELPEAAMVIFDEFHERSLHADLAMALCRETQDVLRPDLKILVMSATLDMPQLQKGLKAPVIESAGRQYPVEVHYGEDADIHLLPDLAARKIVQVANQHDGDILVFLPGQGEIRQVEEQLKPLGGIFSVMPLYGQLPFRKQQAALFPDRNGKRKIVLATSIAETSLTIEGIGVVIDSGFARVAQFDPNTGLSRLTTIRLSHDAADQRAGRAGRLGPGVCYRMWSRATHERLLTHRVPEIEQADLCALMLDLAAWGMEDASSLFWVSPPPAGNLKQSREILRELEIIDDQGLTTHGKAVQRVPCHPRIAHMLIRAKEHDILPLATDLAAVLEERDPLPKEVGVDINLRIEGLRRFRKQDGKNRRFGTINKLSASYRKLFSINEQNGLVDMYEVGWLLANAYPERIACARPGNNAQFQLANGKIAMIGHRDELAHEAWLAVAHIDAREGMGKVFMASPLDPKDLINMLKKKRTVRWDHDEECVQACEELRIGSIVLKSTPLAEVEEEEVQQVLLEVLRREGGHMLNFSDDVKQWQARVMSCATWHPEEDWPEVSTEALLSTVDSWLSPYLQGVRKAKQLYKLDLMEVLQFSLSHEQQGMLERRCPMRIEVPSGSKIKLQYQQDGSSPVLAVRLQEVFGLHDTPKVNHGQQSVLMHLLSPGFKPVQITSDLQSFWANAYFEVKKDLKRRYPKHSWPDDPHEAIAISGVRRKKG
ncbi:ATP-dependent helicase HrpB [Persicobacter psychrovividus]|uniref:ATP-dependent helicase HrpB n=1 Tax=Persicobacter psychrovividus TaxID=387638 RepID=A0ABM7VJG2_9BACT|nr:ATP-dependent helicase HrpB [Persicobacter psychrovividus]